MGFKENITKIEKENDGKICVWFGSNGYCISEDDLDAFCSHMDKWSSISRQLSRSEYEEKCREFGIETVDDSNIGGYGMEYGNFGMGHYHTEPKNRLNAITSSILQARWHGMLHENPNLRAEREAEENRKCEEKRLARVRAKYPSDLNAWIEAVGGLDVIYEKALNMHSNNSTQLREEGRHFEWLIGHTCSRLGMEASEGVPGYVKGSPQNNWNGVYPLHPEWWAGWREKDELHPINRIAAMLLDKKIEPYKGKVTYIGYGEDCGDDVRKNMEEWL